MSFSFDKEKKFIVEKLTKSSVPPEQADSSPTAGRLTKTASRIKMYEEIFEED